MQGSRLSTAEAVVWRQQRADPWGRAEGGAEAPLDNPSCPQKHRGAACCWTDPGCSLSSGLERLPALEGTGSCSSRVLEARGTSFPFGRGRVILGVRVPALSAPSPDTCENPTPVWAGLSRLFPGCFRPLGRQPLPRGHLRGHPANVRSDQPP